MEKIRVSDMKEKEQWRKKTDQIIANNLMVQVAELLGGELKHYTCCDRTTEHQKFIIEYGHQQKDK
jgi:hypothetical protein